MTAVLGLDIGGANLKAAHTAKAALTRVFPLWKHPEQLSSQLRVIREQMPAHDLLAVTMTGELCDCFANKGAGVRAILQSVEEAAHGVPVRIWTTGGTWASPAEIHTDPLPAAAANWLALAYLAAGYSEGVPALLMDVGSTTTDVVYLDHGMPLPLGRTDRQRLASGELVYTGVGRTPVCAVLGLGVASELFATMRDVYLVLGLVPENAGDTATADGRPATQDHARARMARLSCADADEIPCTEIEAMAQRALDNQVGHACAAVDRVLAGRAAPHRIILAGSGEVLGRQILTAHPVLAGVQVVALAEKLGLALSEAACAYAVATRAAQQFADAGT